MDEIELIEIEAASDTPIMTLTTLLSKVYEEQIAKMTKDPFLNQKATRFILAVLSKQDGLTQNDLVRVTHMKGSTISVTLSKLEEEGLIRRFRSEMDGRVHMVQLSTKGRERAERFRRERRSREKMMAAYLSEEERKEFVRLADKIAEGLLEIQQIEDQVEEELKKNSIDVEMAKRDQDIRMIMIERYWGEKLRSGNMQNSTSEE
jgi:DNA-binding MarR family transcriptional regulator